MADDFDEELDNILNPKKRGLGRGLGALFEDERTWLTPTNFGAP